MLAAMLLIAAPVQEPYIEKIPNSTVEFKMAPVPAGKVMIGEKSVEVKPFFMATTETTWELFDAFLLSGEPSPPYDQTQYSPDAIARPSRSYNLPDLGWGHQGYPVINVTHATADMFCRWLRSVTKKNYRLPSEAEWELAAREGKEGEWKLSEEDIAKREWYSGNNQNKTGKVAKREPNALGLFDMLGNVGEWAIDLSGKPVLCGGDFDTEAAKMVPSMRRYYSRKWQESDPQIPKSRWWMSDGWFAGFRLACDP